MMAVVGLLKRKRCKEMSFNITDLFQIVNLQQCVISGEVDIYQYKMMLSMKFYILQFCY